MSEGRRIPFDQAEKILSGLLQRLAPGAERIEAAGAVRRRLEDIGDFEIIAIPKAVKVLIGGQISLFDDTSAEERNGLWVELQNLMEEGRAQPLNPRSGTLDRRWEEKRFFANRSHMFKIALTPKKPFPEVCLDLYMCPPEEWGVTKVIRTGSSTFSYALVTHAAKLGRSIRENRVWIDGKRVDTPHERDVFRVLDLKFVHPSQRSGWEKVQLITEARAS